MSNQRKKYSKRERREHFTAYAFIIPDFAGLLVFVILPIVYALYISFFKWDLVSDKIFIGLDNYIRMFQDKNWWTALLRTLKLTLVYVPGLFCFSLLAAVLVSRIKTKAASFIKTSFLMPFAITSVIASTLWMFLYNEKRGYLNALLNAVGIPDQPFIGSESQAMVSVIIVLLWINIGYNMILFLSAIKDIPSSYQEAATIDGANGWEVFRYITFPLIKQTSIFILITTTIASFQVLDLIMVMTKGGPAKATGVGALYIYDRSFNMMELGYGSALSVFMFVVLLVFSFIQLKLTKEE
ncbi:MAG: sugar ABC transporter permease [Eubacteriales bacterium]|nr:sugar ABC transporter permease [Eubacteriales bacterium]